MRIPVVDGYCEVFRDGDIITLTIPSLIEMSLDEARQLRDELSRLLADELSKLLPQEEPR